MRHSLDYFYGRALHNFLFFRIPKALFRMPLYRKISFEARLLYAILLDRMSLSAKSGWLDGLGRIFIIYTLKEAMEVTGYGHNKVVRIFGELETSGLIERVRRGQGKPPLIYVKDFEAPLDEEGEPVRVETPVSGMNAGGEPQALEGQVSLLPEMELLDTMERELEAEESSAPSFSMDGETDGEDSVEPMPALPVESVDPERDSPAPCSTVAACDDSTSTAEPSPLDRPDNPQTSASHSTETPVSPAGTASSRASRTSPDSRQTSPNRKSGLPKTGTQDFRKSDATKTDKNHTDRTHTDPSNLSAHGTRFSGAGKDWRRKRMEAIEQCRAEIRFNIGYERLREERSADIELVDDYVELMAEVMSSEQPTFYVNRENRPIEQVQERFSWIDQEHMEYILDCMENCHSSITNVRAYMLSTLYNAPITIRRYYDAMVAHDMARDDWCDLYRYARAS